MTVRTLLVDDVPELRVLLRTSLEDSGSFAVVGEAENGVEAVECAARCKPDLVLLDVSMPRQDGMEALPQILEVSPRSRVVMLSAVEAGRLRRTALERGASAYLEKGIDPERLVEELLAVVRAQV